MKLASNLWQTHDSSEWIKYFQQFADGKALFLPTCVNDAQYIRDMEDDYGWVPAPMGPNTNTYASFVEVNAGTMAVLNTRESNRCRKQLVSWVIPWLKLMRTLR